jgi:hypothetical protein
MPSPKKNDFTGGLSAPKSQVSEYNADNVYGLPILENKSQALALMHGEGIRIGALVWKPTGLQVDGEVTREDWEATGKLLKQLDSSLQWLIGDLIVCGEYHQWGEQKAIAEAFDFEYSTIRDFAYVARNVEMSVRTDKLSFGHHKLVAGLKGNEQSYWLDKAIAEGWSIKDLNDALNQADKKEALPKYLLPLRALRKAYNPKAWAAMSKREQHRVFSELKGYLMYMADQLGEPLDLEEEE